MRRRSTQSARFAFAAARPTLAGMITMLTLAGCSTDDLTPTAPSRRPVLDRTVTPTFPVAPDFDVKYEPFRLGPYKESTLDKSADVSKPFLLVTSACSYLPMKEFGTTTTPTNQEDELPYQKPNPVEIPIRERIYPDTHRAYVWTVREPTSGYVDSTRVEIPSARRGQPVSAWPVGCQAGLRLGPPGNYQVQLTVEFTTGMRASRTHTQHVGPQYIVASIGDSYASGEGVPNEPGALSEASAVPGWPSDAKRCEDWTTHQMIFNPTYTMDTPVQWLEERAHRSNRSAAYKAAWDLAAEGRRVTLTTFASSGAEVSAGLLLKQHTWQPSGQLDQLRKAVGTNRIDALLISIGGNDVGFADALTWLTAPGGLSGGKSAAAVRAVVEPKIEDVSTRLDAVNAQIKGLGLNVGTVYLVEYPESHFELPTMDPVTGKLKTQACGVFDTSLAGFGRLFGANPADRELTHDLAAKLNRALRDKATALGWQVVGGIADGFRGHGYCAPEPYFVGASRSCAAQGNFDGTMHPNEKGINVQRARIRATLASKLAI